VAVEVVYPWWRNLKKYLPEELGWKPDFNVIRCRWVVERKFVWLSRSRRLSKDYERLVETGESLIYLTLSLLILRRLAKT
jgi:putative transposase